MLAYIVLEICRWRGSEILVFPILSVLSDSDDEFLFFLCFAWGWGYGVHTGAGEATHFR